MTGPSRAERTPVNPSISALLLVAGVTTLASPPAQAQSSCPDQEFCPLDSGTPDTGPGHDAGSGDCWDDEFGDTCNDPPPPCPPEEEPGFEFIDSQDGDDNGQIMARSDTDPHVSCGVIRVDKTGYFRIYDAELSESCQDQVDETGYLTVENSCNPEGWAAEANQDNRYLVLDSDNTDPCEQDSDCEAGRVCREGNAHGNCCVPETPTFMGTFLLVEGEDNRICLRHWCPEYLELVEQGEDPGFVTGGCTGSPNSIHFRIDENAIACEEDTMLMNCSFGCEDGVCLPDPCDAMDCPQYCQNGECVFDDPCQDLDCAHGCKNGRCLQPPSAPGPDGDGDGYPFAADCDDAKASINPGQSEICGNGLDDDCDGVVDEPGCTGDQGPGAGPTNGGFAGSGVSADGGLPAKGGNASGGDDTGCGCRMTSPANRTAPLLLFLVVLGLYRRRMESARARRG